MLKSCEISPSQLVGLKVVDEGTLEHLNKAYEGAYKGHIGKPSEDLYKYVVGHSKRVARYSFSVAAELRLTVQDCLKVAIAALLHDFDKFSWREDYLRPDLWDEGDVSETRLRIVQQHPSSSAAYISRKVCGHLSEDILDAIRYHHKRYDGHGYPEKPKLTKERYKLARILKVTDSYDAGRMRNMKNHETMIRELQEGAEKKYDPAVVEAFCKWFSGAADCEKIAAIC
jgi:HD-GYP domain-containing protein (c-di-GMP phosphodiesterase class II)